MHKSRKVHWTTVLRILTYVESSPRKDLLYKYEHVHISSDSNSEYAGDKRDRKSTTGYYTFVGENIVTWKSKK